MPRGLPDPPGTGNEVLRPGNLVQGKAALRSDPRREQPVPLGQAVSQQWPSIRFISESHVAEQVQLPASPRPQGA
ncbi:hypothetical protein D3C81_1096870 [compost metagenome]